MKVSFNFSQEKMVSRKIIKEVETSCQTLLTSDEEGGIGKILDCYGLASINAEERVQGDLRFSGKVLISVLFETKNKMLSVLTGEMEFADKTALPTLDWTFANANIIKLKARKESDNSVSIDGVVGISFSGIKNEEIKLLLPKSENCFEKLASFNVDELVCVSGDNFDLPFEFEVAEPISKIVGCYPTLLLSKFEAFDGYITVSGDVVCDFIYISGEHVRKITKTFDFTQEISISGSKKEAKLDVSAVLRSYTISSETFEEQNKTVASLTCSIKTNAFEFVSKKIEAVVDLFSTIQKLTLTNECVINPSFESTTIFSEKMNLAYDASKFKRIDEVISVMPTFINITQSKIENEMAVISGEFGANVVYKNYEQDAIFSSEITFPYVVQAAAHNATSILANANLLILNYKNKPGKEISVSVELGFVCRLENQTYDCFVSNIVESDYENKKSAAITIYYPSEDQDSYAIAKDLATSPLELEKQNKDLSAGKIPEKIVVYKQS